MSDQGKLDTLAYFAKATAMARRLARLPISTAAKAKAILSKIMPMAMYGVELADPPRKQFGQIMLGHSHMHCTKKVQ